MASSFHRPRPSKYLFCGHMEPAAVQQQMLLKVSPESTIFCVPKNPFPHCQWSVCTCRWWQSGWLDESTPSTACCVMLDKSLSLWVHQFSQVLHTGSAQGKWWGVLCSGDWLLHPSSHSANLGNVALLVHSHQLRGWWIKPSGFKDNPLLSLGAGAERMMGFCLLPPRLNIYLSLSEG